jgi:hypothetical protein
MVKHLNECHTEPLRGAILACKDEKFILVQAQYAINDHLYRSIQITHIHTIDNHLFSFVPYTAYHYHTNTLVDVLQ